MCPAQRRCRPLPPCGGPAENTSTPSPTAPAEIGKEFDDLSFLNEEQRQAYEGAYKLNYTLYGLPDNLVGVDVSPRFTQQSDSEGVFVLTVGNYALYENPYTDFTNLMQSVFTTDFIRRLGPLYTEKFIDLDGHLATSCDSVLACPMHDDLSRTVMDNCPDTYRLESVTGDTVVFALISTMTGTGQALLRLTIWTCTPSNTPSACAHRGWLAGR